ncbi:Centrosomal protein of 72 kDa [Manis javanica]|nr:centrosomal protein of 72 kDa isoform X1 [Manis javanica]KAI5938803.1 Centrosomal protein of 72 kDa [Manis javanica]
MALAFPRLVLCEEKIREKSGLAPNRDLAELQSLSIPGTYQEKITHLGNSLMNLTGLKSLDLSCNSLVSLEGIQCLAVLQSLNLYYNCISSLAEVFRLRSLTELTDVDLRLNPVVKTESGYLLFVVHMLPKLRQLDDRPVRESERKASQLHFASEESLDSKQSIPDVFRARRLCRSRAMCTDPSAKKCLVMDADDEAVLNLIAECEWNLGNPPGSTSSSQREREAGFHEASTDLEDSAPSSQTSSLSTQKGLNPLPAPNKHRKQRMLGGRFQVPADEECPSCPVRPGGPSSPDEGLSQQSSWEGQSGVAFPPSGVPEPEERRPHGMSGPRKVSPKPLSTVLPGKKTALEAVLLEALLDLVDRYWSGYKSLHSNETFLAQARHILSSVQEFTATQDNSTIMNEEIHSLTLEKKSLQSHLAEQQNSVKMSEVLSELSHVQEEVGDLRQHLHKCLEENNSLKSLLFSMKEEVRNADASATLNLQITGLQAGVKKLSGEMAELRQHLEHYDKIQELVGMLQESHRSWARPASSTGPRRNSCTGATGSSGRPWPCSRAAGTAALGVSWAPLQALWAEGLPPPSLPLVITL